MKSMNWRSTIAAFLLMSAPTLLSCEMVRAEEPSDGTVSAAGTASVERKPDLIRMQIEVAAEGKDIREAVANLRALEQSDKEKLVKLGAAESSISFADPVPGSSADQQRQQMEQMVRMRTGRRGPATGPAQPSVTVSTTLKAEWPVKAETGDDLLVEAHALQAKIKEANLSTPPAKPNRTPEEEEAAEEAAGLQGQNGEATPGAAYFLFIGKVSEEDRAKATAEAFQKAKAEAGRLAHAAGGELGALRRLNANAGPDADASRYGSDYEYANYRRMLYNQQLQQGQASDESNSEAIGLQPGKVTYKVMVSVSFSLK